MDKNKRDLESLVSSQKEQLIRYETRLKDVVTAYKGLLKEKEALEASLATLISSSGGKTQNNNGESEPSGMQSSTVDKNASESEGRSLQIQIATLMNSLATLSAEKSRMEASFQADKKLLRGDLAQKDKTISEIKEKTNEIIKQNAIEIENMKSKIIVERHEREKESSNHMLMIRELQKLYADERHLKENLEMQLNNLKDQFSSLDNSKLRELSAELRESKERVKQYESKKENFSEDNTSILQQLQNEMQHLKQQHAIAIKNEQKRAYVAEERSKKLVALHEDRVANLEARLAELSSSVGNYDRLRQQDQGNIQKLKEKIVELASGKEEESKPKPTKVNVDTIIDEIMRLKKILLNENARSPSLIDLSKIFNIGNDHTQCSEDYNKMKTELESVLKENEDYKQAIEIQKVHIKTLQEKVKVLNRNIDEQEIELKSHNEKLIQAVKSEKTKWKEMLNSLENEYRFKLNDIEQQLQKQRVRSLQLLDEKENEIKALKTSFEIFAPQSHSNVLPDEDTSSDRQRKKSSSLHMHAVLGASTGNVGNSISDGTENCHMLHYVNEIARKDVEISMLRKAKYLAENSLRQALQDKVTAQEELNEKINFLEQQVDRLERCKTREGANLEYLKNVIICFLSTSNVDGKKHMINAIGAVLQFTPAEMKAINCLFHN